LKGLRFPKRKQKTSTRREHLWTPAEHKVFLERVEDLRLACYHAIALETGARPSELLALRIRDIEIKTSASTGKKYAEFQVGQYGKSRKARPATISDAIPYFNVWHAVHPQRDDPTGNAYLFPSLEKSNKYRNKPLEEDSLRLFYYFSGLTRKPTEYIVPQIIVIRHICGKTIPVYLSITLASDHLIIRPHPQDHQPRSSLSLITSTQVDYSDDGYIFFSFLLL
jgi:hypothetical protein